VPAWLRPTGPENRLPVAAAILVAIALQIGLSDRYGLHPRWLLPALEVALLAVLTAINPVRLSRRTRVGRYLTMALAGAITLDNLVSAFVLDYSIVTGKTGNDAIGLLSAGAAIYLTNIIVFGIWYWELDRGGRSAGPPQRSRTRTSSSPRWPPQRSAQSTGSHVSSTTSTPASPTSWRSRRPTPCRCHGGRSH
jgi:hypothetical protein